MKKSVNAGQVSWIKSMGKVAAFLGPVLTKSLKSLLDFGIQYEKFQKDDETGGFKFLARTGEDHAIKVKCVPVADRTNLYDMYIQSDSGKKKEYPHVKADNFDEKLKEFIEMAYPGESLEDTFEDAKSEGRTNDRSADFNINESNHIKVTLRKVQAGTESTIVCDGVETIMYPPVAMNILSDVCNDDSFCDSLTESPTSFDIANQNDEYIVNPCKDLPNTTTTYEKLVSCFYTCLLNLQTIHWNLRGPQFMRIHTMVGDYIYKLIGDIDTIAEIGLQSNCCMISPVKLVQGIPNKCPNGAIEGPDSIRLVKICLSDLIICLNFYYPNVPHEVQSLFDEWINFWRVECDFKFDRMT